MLIFRVPGHSVAPSANLASQACRVRGDSFLVDQPQSAERGARKYPDGFKLTKNAGVGLK